VREGGKEGGWLKEWGGWGIKGGENGRQEPKRGFPKTKKRGKFGGGPVKPHQIKGKEQKKRRSPPRGRTAIKKRGHG